MDKPNGIQDPEQQKISTQNLIEILIKEYAMRLLEAKKSLLDLKNNPDPTNRILAGLPIITEIKERVINYRKMLDDLVRIQKSIMRRSPDEETS